MFGTQNGFDKMVHSKIRHVVPLIEPAELKKKIESGIEITLLDAREKSEYSVSHLKNAIHVGYDHFNISSIATLPKNRLTIVYCSIGVRSENIAEKLRKTGFTDVKNLFGGIFKWVNSGYPVYTTGNTETSAIHPYSKSWGKWLTKGQKRYE
ncbi:MAG: rhodanese-like domain-containing protein [Flavobacteriales bacterium]